MHGTKAQRWAIVILSALAAASVLPSFGGGSTGSRDDRSTYCGSFASTSVYPIARVTALRGVSCPKALQVARGYDNRGKQLGRWRCALAHGEGRLLFSCGKGAREGNLRKMPHGLIAKGGPASRTG